MIKNSPNSDSEGEEPSINRRNAPISINFGTFEPNIETKNR